MDDSTKLGVAPKISLEELAVRLPTLLYNQNIDGLLQVFAEAGPEQAKALANTRNKTDDMPLVYTTIRDGSNVMFNALRYNGADLAARFGPINQQGLHIAAMYNRREMALEMIDKLNIKPEPNKLGQWPSDISSKQNYKKLTAALFIREPKGKILSATNVSDPEKIAAGIKDVLSDIPEEQKKAVVNGKDPSGKPILYTVIKVNNIPAFKALVDAGAEPWKFLDGTSTGLHIAAMHDRKDLAIMMLDMMDSLKIKPVADLRNHRMPSEVARISGHRELSKILAIREPTITTIQPENFLRGGPSSGFCRNEGLKSTIPYNNRQKVS